MEGVALLTAAAAAALAPLALLLLRKDPPPLFGVYSRPGKWYYLKYLLFSAVYYFRKYAHRRCAAAVGARAGQDVRALADTARMDRAQPLGDHAKAFDAVFFIAAGEGSAAGSAAGSTAGSTTGGEGVYVMMGCERRPLGMCNGLFYIGLPGLGLLCSRKLPDTVLFGAASGEFAAEGVRLAPVEPMRRWALSYRGPMWFQSDPSKVVEVSFSGEWAANSEHFDFDCDLHAPAVIRSIAREPWSRHYFEGLKTAHQSHYEQFGMLRCSVSLAGSVPAGAGPAVVGAGAGPGGAGAGPAVVGAGAGPGGAGAGPAVVGAGAGPGGAGAGPAVVGAGAGPGGAGAGPAVVGAGAGPGGAGAGPAVVGAGAGPGGAGAGPAVVGAGAGPGGAGAGPAVVGAGAGPGGAGAGPAVVGAGAGPGGAGAGPAVVGAGAGAGEARPGRLQLELELELPSFRDHSFGARRDWSLMHRYAFHHIFLADGLRISVGVICQPSTATTFEVGVMAFPDGRVVPVERVDMPLWRYGERGTAPLDYGFSFHARGQDYYVQVMVEHSATHYVSAEWEARMAERFCKYVVNGAPGRGTCEFQYRYRGGRPAGTADPEWYRTMCRSRSL